MYIRFDDFSKYRPKTLLYIVNQKAGINTIRIGKHNSENPVPKPHQADCRPWPLPCEIFSINYERLRR
jgi:hypothetical protein